MNESKKEAIQKASYGYSVCILQTLCDMGLITEAEFKRIQALSAEHYGAEHYCV